MRWPIHDANSSSRERPLTAAAGLGLPVGSAAVSPFQGLDDGAGPDLVVINARIFTIEVEGPRAEAFAVKNGRFIAVGSTGEIRPLATGNTQIIDAEAMTVTPGFVDAHSHPSGAGVSELINVNVDLRSIAEIKEAMRDRASITPDGEWVIGFKYDDTKLNEGRPLNRLDLDEAVPRNPAMARHRGGHTAVYNSRAFELAGVTADTPDPDDGKFYRENGELTGKVAERARNVFSRLIPSGSTREQRQAGRTPDFGDHDPLGSDISASDRRRHERPCGLPGRLPRGRTAFPHVPRVDLVDEQKNRPLGSPEQRSPLPIDGRSPCSGVDHKQQ